MSSPTAPPIASLVQFPTSCWALRNPDGTSIGVGGDLDLRHFDTETQALEGLADERGGQEGERPVPVELTDRCWRVACGRCGENLDCDEFSVQHFATEADARWQAGECGWVTASDGELYEPDCAPDEETPDV